MEANREIKLRVEAEVEELPGEGSGGEEVTREKTVEGTRGEPSASCAAPTVSGEGMPSNNGRDEALAGPDGIVRPEGRRIIYQSTQASDGDVLIKGKMMPEFSFLKDCTFKDHWEAAQTLMTSSDRQLLSDEGGLGILVRYLLSSGIQHLVLLGHLFHFEHQREEMDKVRMEHVRKTSEALEEALQKILRYRTEVEQLRLELVEEKNKLAIVEGACVEAVAARDASQQALERVTSRGAEASSSFETLTTALAVFSDHYRQLEGELAASKEAATREAAFTPDILQRLFQTHDPLYFQAHMYSFLQGVAALKLMIKEQGLLTHEQLGSLRGSAVIKKLFNVDCELSDPVMKRLKRVKDIFEIN